MPVLIRKSAVRQLYLMHLNCHQYLESLVHGALLLAAEALSMLVIQRLL